MSTTTTTTSKKTISLENPRPFDYNDETRGSAGLRWPKWIRDFELFLIGTNIDDDGQKIAVLLHIVGEAVRDIYYAQA
jgi:hypothetical protein